MPIIESRLNPRSEDFRANTAALEAVVADLRAKIEQLAQGGGQAARDKHLSRGKLLPRDRIAQLLDPGAPFLELSQLAANGMYNDDAPGAGVITGIGRIAGREVPQVRQRAGIIASLHRNPRQGTLRSHSLRINLQGRLGGCPGDIGFARAELRLREPF